VRDLHLVEQVIHFGPVAAVDILGTAGFLGTILAGSILLGLNLYALKRKTAAVAKNRMSPKSRGLLALAKCRPAR
jgi:hypothetical protein